MRFIRIITFVLALAASLGATAQWSPTKETFDIANPEMRVFLPNDDINTGRAVVACPGGSYLGHAIGHEGWDWAPFFNKQGIALIVLRYTLPAGDRSKPIADAEAAIRMVRDSAEVWHIDPNQVGIMGSSAGGHLASTIATHSTGKAKPDFQILFYPVISMYPERGHQMTHDNFLGKDASVELMDLYSNEKQVTKETPRAIILTSDDDTGVNSARNSAAYYMALNEAGVPAALHVYPTGGHGWGCGQAFRHHVQMQTDLSEWLKTF